MMILQVLGALLVTTMAGLGLVSWLRVHRQIHGLETIGLSMLVGSVAISLLVLGASVLGCRGNILVGIVSAISLGLGAAGVARLRHVRWTGSLALAGFVIVVTAIVGWQAMVFPLGQDGLLNFEVRAHLGFAEGGAIPMAFFGDQSRRYMHASYPLFVPLNQLWLYLCAGEASQALAKVVGVFWFAGAAAYLGGAMARLRQSVLSGALGIGFLLTIPAVAFWPGGAAWSWGDFPLGAFAMIAALSLATGQDRRLLAFVLATLPWIKRDGLIVGGVLLFIVVVTALQRRDYRFFLATTVPFLVVVAGWRTFLAWVGAPGVNDFALPSGDLLADNLERMPSLVAILFRELVVWQRWGIFWPVVLLAAIRVLRTSALAPWRAIVAAMMTLLALYVGMYLFSAWPDVIWHMITSLPRLILPVSMLAIPMVLAAIPPRGEEGDPSPPAPAQAAA